MNKKIILNGIELSLPKYDGTAVTLFDYLDEAIHFLPPMAMHREKVFSKVYQEDFDEKKLRHTTSFLLKVF